MQGERVELPPKVQEITEEGVDEIIEVVQPSVAQEVREVLNLNVDPHIESRSLSDEMMKLGEDMVKHCGGLPLAIGVLGGLLARKYTLDEWKKVSRDLELRSRTGKSQGGVPAINILDLCYNDLPCHLKACFLYLSDLPKDEGIRPVKLVQKWMAEGFVSLPVSAPTREVVEETLLDIGMSYLDELCQRSMVIAGPRTRFSKRVKFYHLHDIMRDFCLLKAQEENFMKVVFMGEDPATTTLSSSSYSSSTIRRLGVYCRANQTVGGGSSSSRKGYRKPLVSEKNWNLHSVRSCQFYFFGNLLEDDDWRHLKSTLKGFKLLRFLDLEKTKFTGKDKTLPQAIGKLVYLRYLSIRDSGIDGLPSSIGNLILLETLDLRCPRVEVPNVLRRLKQLKHLYLPHFIDRRPRPFKAKLQLDGLSNLETLEGFDSTTCDVRCFSTLTNLRRLGVELVGDSKDLAIILESPSLCNSNGLLRFSSFGIRKYSEIGKRQSLLRQVLGLHHLYKLVLQSKESKLPDVFPQNLTHFTLSSCLGKEDPMPTLGKFPNLRYLMMEGKWKGMVCCAGSFPQLEYLELHTNDLREWRVEQGAMPNLLHIVISKGRELREIPDGFRFVTTLRVLKVMVVSKELRDRIQEGGEDFSKIQHIHSIIINEQ